VLNILLQIFDDGRITDAQGRVVNFENTIIVMTSNAGSERNDYAVGFGKTTAEISKDKALKALSEFMRPEFLGRIDEIVVFAPLNIAALEKIAELMMNDFKAVMSEKGINLNFDKTVCKQLASQAEGSKSGARELRNKIRKNIEDRIVDLIINNCESPLSEINITYKNGYQISHK